MSTAEKLAELPKLSREDGRKPCWAAQAGCAVLLVQRMIASFRELWPWCAIFAIIWATAA